MPYEKPGQSISLVAGADLSAIQYRFVKQSTGDQIIPIGAVTDVVLGVLQNAPASGAVAEVMMTGVTKLVSASALAISSTGGTTIGTNTAGNAVLSSTGPVPVLGRVLLASTASGGIISAAIDCIAPVMS